MFHWQLLLVLLLPCALAGSNEDLYWVERPNAWHQQAIRIVDHQFRSFPELKTFATQAKQAGVSVVQLVGPQKRKACPGPWYGGLQLCDHINGTFPAGDGTLAEWQAMLTELKPLRFMWWTNLAYWSAQGPVFQQALSDTRAGVGTFFTWANTSAALTLCAGRYSTTSQASGFTNPCGTDARGDHQCAQGSWGSLEASAVNKPGFKACACYPGFPGKCLPSALANLAHESYSAYLVDSLANSWSKNLGIDGYFIDTSMQYPCMPGLDKDPAAPHGSESVFFRDIIDQVRQTQPQIVMSGEDWASYDDIIARNAQLGGHKGGFAPATQKAVLSKNLSALEPLVSNTDGAVLTCYLHPKLDGLQPGGCPSLSHRDTASPLQWPSAREYRMWVAVEAASGILSQHQVARCGVWDTPNMGVDPFDSSPSPLWAFQQHRALSRLTLRTKLNITGGSPRGVDGDSPQGVDGGSPRGALAYLKHDSLGPDGDAAVVIFNPGQAQTLTLDLSMLPSSLLDGRVVPHDLFDPNGTNATTPLSASWSVPMRAGEMRAFAGFTLGVFAPRKGKKTSCTADDGFERRVTDSTTLQQCFLACHRESRCQHVFVDFVAVGFLQPVPPVVCTLLGAIADPGGACKEGKGTLVKKMVTRPRA